MLGTRLLLRQRWQPARQLHCCRPHARSFHATAPRHHPVLDTVLFLPHELMNLIHLAVPWYAAIPVTAFVTRALLVTTAGLWARKLTARYVGLHPLRQAKAFAITQNVMHRGGFNNPAEVKRAVQNEVKAETTKFDGRWKVSLKAQLGWTLAQIPIFFAMAETIRQKCAARDGLLGLTFSAFTSNKEPVAPGEEGVVSSSDGLLPADPSTLAVNEGAATTTSSWFEPTLASEGILWFPDLLVPDPTGVLPFVVGGLMFINVYRSKSPAQTGASWPNAIRKVLLSLSLLVGFLCQGLPSAIMLYWAGSTTSVMLWNAWLDWKYPAPQGFVACKRPLVFPPVPKGRVRRV